MALAMSAAQTRLGAQAPVPSPARSVTDGVFTVEQADRGQQVFAQLCADCHAARMWGGDWNGKTVADVFDFISIFMPEQNPGSLTAEQVVDVIAHILRANDAPPGPNELPATVADLQAVLMVRPGR